MCGICGYACPGREAEGHVLRGMCARIQRRGPDATGIYCASGIGLGHTRLKVIDLSTGQQPMHDPSGRFSIVFNGEIYNYRELRQELAGEGFVFRTESDTEVLLYACMHFGEAALPRLTGMFAFAFWDSAEQTLLLARDRLGVKPLYYALGGDALVFGSELSAVAASGLIPLTRNEDALRSYCNLGYIVGEQSIMQGISRLLPGHRIMFRQGRVDVRCWWDLAEQWKRAPRHNISLDQSVEGFQALLDTCVADRLASDVPLGAFLSGGVDSSAVVAAMRRQREDVFTFTMAFADPRFDEGPQAAQVARHLMCTHRQSTADLDALAVLLDLAAHLDEPFADTSVIPTHMLCGIAKEHITVALSGDGGDELLAGYVTLHADALFPYLRAVPRPFMALLQGCANLLPDIRGKVSFTYKLKQFLAAYPLSPEDAHAWWRMLFSGEQVARLLPQCRDQVESLFAPFRKAWEAGEGLEILDRFLLVDYKTWLVDDILYKADRASMQHGLEVRSPFLDHRLVEYCAGLPPQHKRVGGKGKIVLKKATEARVPQSILDAPKRGFNAPVSSWLCAEWRDLAEEAFTPAHLTKCGLAPESVHVLWREHLSGRRDHGFRLFALLMYALWWGKR